MFATPRFLPGSTTLISNLEPANQTTLHNLMRGVGATPQTVTLSSSTTLKAFRDIVVPITGTGIVGSATATWSINGSTPVPFTIQSVVALAGTPYSLGFDAGTYTALDSYRSVIGNVTDDLGNVFDGASAAADVRPYLGFVTGGFPAIETDAVGSFLQTVDGALSTAMISGTDKVFLEVVVAEYTGDLTPAISAPMVSFCDGSATGPAFWDFGVSPTGFWRSRKRGDAGGTVIVDSAVAADNALHTFGFLQLGTTITSYVDGVAVMSAVSQNVGITTCQFAKIGQLSVSGLPPNETYGALKLAAHAMYTGNPGTNQRNYIFQNYKTRFGTP